MEETTLLCYSLLAPVSVVSEIIMILSFWRLNLFKHHPEILIFWQCIAQLLVDIHWFTGISAIHSLVKGTGCLILGAAFMYFYYLGWAYNVLLSVEILLKLLNPQNIGYDKRRHWYHYLSHGTGLIVFIIITASGTNGESILKTCSVEHGTILELFMILPVIIHFPICLSLVLYSIYISSNTFYSSHLKYHMIVVTVFSISWIPMGVIHGISYKEFRFRPPDLAVQVFCMKASVILGACSGFLVFCARLMQKGLLRKVVLVLFFPSHLKSDLNISLTENKWTNPSELSYSEMFDHATVEGIRDLLNSVVTILKNSENPNNSKEDCREWNLNCGFSKKKIHIVQHNMQIFEEIMKLCGIWYSELIESFNLDSSLEEFNKQLECEQEKCKFNFTTVDSEFSVKTISSKELMCLKSMIQDYSRHLKYEKGSYLAKIFGLFKIKIEGSKAIRVIIIENQGSCLMNPIIFHLDGRLGQKIDSIRGENKELEGLDEDIIYEDKDFFKCIGAFNISNAEHEKIMKKLERDTKFLMKHLVVEYSLNLLTENNTCIKQSIIQKDYVTISGKYIVYIGIIGFLQGYDVKKKMNKIGKKRFEKYFKSDEYCPKSYRKRFLFMAKNLFKVLNVN